MGPCTASHCCCLHRHTLPCARLSGLLTTAVGSILCHRLLYASHCCCLHATTVAPKHWFWPRDCPNVVKCAGDSKIRRHSSACHTD
ncbi:unnamed protein product [Staurois parvus]|uniref:Secreted protein n=1 Tax=Staurois parvus TaxID=386267 RepID=A0ABN9B3A1_9NEOB|nr:unnamed protein product [Staurois parvus]